MQRLRVCGFVGLSALFLVLSGCDLSQLAKPASSERSNGKPYLERLRSFQTKLIHQGPSPQESQPLVPPSGVEEIQYRSGPLNLKAWVAVPHSSTDQTFPALVYLHGGFAFGAEDLLDCRPFLDAGFVVMCPMLRGENGNPGNFELLFGEVEDAKAAINWLARQPYVDRGAIYTFGHSVGGGISAVLSLHDDVPIRHGGSSGGLYDTATFDDWADIVPFDRSNPEERQLRILLGNVSDMQRRHYAYVGTLDNLKYIRRQFAAEMQSESCQLEIISVAGDHFSSLERAMRQYLQVIQQDLADRRN